MTTGRGRRHRFSCLLFWMTEKQMLLVKYIHNDLSWELSLEKLWDVYAGRIQTQLQHVCFCYCSVPVASSGPWSSSFRIRVHLYWLEYCSMLHKADASVPHFPIRMRTMRRSSNIKYWRGEYLFFLIQKWQRLLITQSRTVYSLLLGSIRLLLVHFAESCSTTCRMCKDTSSQLKYLGETWKCWFLNLTEAPSSNVAPLFTLWSTYQMAILFRSASIHPPSIQTCLLYGNIS